MKTTTHPIHGTCNICNLPLNSWPPGSVDARLTKHAGDWLHRVCWERGHE